LCDFQALSEKVFIAVEILNKLNFLSIYL